MRFLILSQYFPPEIGASQVRLAAVATELCRLGHQVEVVTGLPNYPTGRIFPDYRGRVHMRENWNGIPVHRVWLYPATGAGLRRMLNYGSFVTTSFYGLKGVPRPDFIFVESPPLFTVLPGWFASRWWKAPLILNVADLWPDSIRELGLMQNGAFLRLAGRLEHWAYRKARFINAVTEGIRTTLIREKGVSPDRILFLPNGVDTELFSPRPPDRALARHMGLHGKKILVYAGNVGYAQGLEVGLRAMSLLRDAAQDLVLIIVGDGSARRQLQELAGELRLANVRFVPPQPPEYVASILSLSLAGLVTLKALPLFEGARPSKVFPIMASGKPVIYSGSGEGARLVEAARAGIVVPPENPEALAAAIRTLLENPTLAEEMGRNGRRYVEENFTWSKVVGRWLEDLEMRCREAAKPTESS